MALYFCCLYPHHAARVGDQSQEIDGALQVLLLLVREGRQAVPYSLAHHGRVIALEDRGSEPAEVELQVALGRRDVEGVAVTERLLELRGEDDADHALMLGLVLLLIHLLGCRESMQGR
jgi:hypothetical protein